QGWRRYRGPPTGVATAGRRPGRVGRMPASWDRLGVVSWCPFLIDEPCKDRLAVREARLGRSNGNVKSERRLFDRETLLIVKEQHRTAGGRHLLDGLEKAWLQRFGQRWGCRQRSDHVQIEALPARFAFQVAEGMAGCKAGGPGTESCRVGEGAKN